MLDWYDVTTAFKSNMKLILNESFYDEFIEHLNVRIREHVGRICTSMCR